MSPVWKGFQNCLPQPKLQVRRAFTLTEMLVAMAVLSLIVLIVGQMVSSSSNLAIGARKRLDAEEQARLLMGRIGDDLTRRLIRKDVEVLFANPAGNDAFYFYSEAPASFDASVGSTKKSAVALLGYRINSDNSSDNYARLERLGKGLQWDGSSLSPIFVTYDSSGNVLSQSKLANAWPTAVGNSPEFRNGTDGKFQLLADGIIRLETAFLMKDGKITQDPNKSAAPVGPLASPVTTDLTQVSAIIVAIAILDETSQKVAGASKLPAIASALDDPVATDLAKNPPVLMAQTWRDKIDSGAVASAAGIPAAVASQIRIYQRIYLLQAQ